MTLATVALGTPIACALMGGLYLFACHVAGHIHQPSPSGRCAVCGLDPQETR